MNSSLSSWLQILMDRQCENKETGIHGGHTDYFWDISLFGRFRSNPVAHNEG